MQVATRTNYFPCPRAGGAPITAPETFFIGSSDIFGTPTPIWEWTDIGGALWVDLEIPIIGRLNLTGMKLAFFTSIWSESLYYEPIALFRNDDGDVDRLTLPGRPTRTTFWQYYPDPYILVEAPLASVLVEDEPLVLRISADSYSPGNARPLKVGFPMIIPVAEQPAYFDGDTPPVLGTSYRWSGSPNSSPSQAITSFIRSDSPVAVSLIRDLSWSPSSTGRISAASATVEMVQED